MKIRIKFPEEVLISEGAEWIVEIPTAVNASEVYNDDGPDQPVFVVTRIE